MLQSILYNTLLYYGISPIILLSQALLTHRPVENQEPGTRRRALYPCASGVSTRATVAERPHVIYVTIHHAIESLSIALEQYRVRRQNGQPSHKRGYHLSPRQAEQVLGRSLGTTVH